MSAEASESRQSEREELGRAIARMRASVMALVFGLTGGTGLMLATVWLLIRGGPNIGQHLSLLSVYFPGYSVTWPGAAVGFVYGCLTCGVAGWAVAWIYNRLAGRRG